MACSKRYKLSWTIGFSRGEPDWTWCSASSCSISETKIRNFGGMGLLIQDLGNRYTTKITTVSASAIFRLPWVWNVTKPKPNAGNGSPYEARCKKTVQCYKKRLWVCFFFIMGWNCDLYFYYFGLNNFWFFGWIKKITELWKGSLYNLVGKRKGGRPNPSITDDPGYIRGISSINPPP